MKFYWLPSHINIYENDAADRLAKMSTGKEQVDFVCPLTLRQIRTTIKVRQRDTLSDLWVGMYEVYIPTFQHYILVNEDTAVTYGRQRSSQYDTVIMRLRLGYSRYYWELGYKVRDRDKKSRLCEAREGHTLPHYILQCPRLANYRNNNIADLTQQVIWMINNKKIEEILLVYKKFAPRV